MYLARIRTFLFSALAMSGALLLSGCNWPNVFDNEQPNDFAEKTYARHRDNGDIPQAQYQQGIQSFTPAAALPGSTTAPAAGTTQTQP